MEYQVMLRENLILFLVLGLADVLLGILLSRKMCIIFSKHVSAALGGRRTADSLHKKCLLLAGRGISVCERKLEKGRIYQKAKLKMCKAGYRSEKAALIYLCVKFVLSPLVFLAALLTNYPNVAGALAAAVLINVIMEMIINSSRKQINLRFQKYIYKIYKYLHNQISSGVKPTDAVRCVYEVTEDRELRDILIRLAARYELTLDIDAALNEFRSNFDTHEAETLCIAIRQGIETGDNKELLAKQEDMMFKKYFNYVQAETDSCKNRSVAAATVFVAIVAVMIIVPMLNEVNQAIGNIFIY